MRYSEKLLEQNGITIETLDLSEVFGRAAHVSESDPRFKAKYDQMLAYVPTNGIPPESLIKMAKFGAVVDAWAGQLELKATAIQCWTAMEDYSGVVPCTLMSMMSNDLMPSACETDIPVMNYQEIIAGTVGKENTYGTIVGEGELTDDPLKTFGGYGVVRVPNLQKLLNYICENGFEHHTAINPSLTASAVGEALGKYLGWQVYQHQ